MRCPRWRNFSASLLLAAGCSAPLSPDPASPAVRLAVSSEQFEAGSRALLYAGGPTQNAVGAYRAYRHNPQPLRQIVNALSAPTGIAVDSAGNVYVCNNSGMRAHSRNAGKGTWTVTVYHRGAATPFEAYTDGVWSPVDVAIAGDGTVYIANYSSAVTVYSSGSLHPSRTLVGPSGGAPLGIAFDTSGNIYVSYVFTSGGGSIFKYAPHHNHGSDLGIAFSGSPHGVAVDRQGNLAVSVSNAPNPGSSIEIFAPGGTHPKKTITGVFQPFMLAFSTDGGRLFAADFASGNNDGAVFVFAYPSGRLIGKDSQGPAASAYGVAFDPNLR